MSIAEQAQTVDKPSTEARESARPAQPRGPGDRMPEIPWRVRWLPPEMLVQDPAYQRRFEPAIGRRLQERYIPELLAAVRVSLRDGIYYVKDGWHRVQAAIGLGLREIHCYVEEQTQAEEARDFVGLDLLRPRAEARSRRVYWPCWRSGTIIRSRSRVRN